MTRFLTLVSLLILLLSACGSPYKKLRPSGTHDAKTVSSADIAKYRPVYPGLQKALYRCHVDGRFLFKKFHLSGILLFRNFQNGDTRVVFSNEMGFTFFDFGWDGSDSFKVNSIIPQLDKPAVIKTLRKDLELVLVRNTHSVEIFLDGDTIYYRSSLPKGYAYYIVQATKLRRIEIARRKKVATIYPIGKRTDNDMPDSLSIVHHKAHFTIQAKKITDVSAE